MAAGEAPHVISGGNINPARFVTVSTSANNTVVESNAADKPILGISHDSTKLAPESGAANSYHAESGDPVHVHVMGEICYLQIDASGCTAADWLKPDNDGKGDVASAGDEVGAFALETVAANEKCKVLVLPPGFQMP